MKNPIRLLLPLLTVMVLGASPAPAASKPFTGLATITACQDDALTVGAEIKPSSGDVGRRAARRVRGARLKLKIEAAPLYGDRVLSDEVDLGAGTTGRRFERFSGLAAQTYRGIVRYRFAKGSRTVAAGIVRTTRTRAAGRRGRATCTLTVGKPPEDKLAPLVIPIPFDSAWKAGPLDISFFALDDLSGVSSVLWSLDRGPIRTGRRLRIETEGTHTLDYIARDVAGNQSKPNRITLRVDMGPPTTPKVTSPGGPTVDTTPEIRWEASTDTASGVQSYWVLVRDANKTIVFAKVVAASGPLAVQVPALAAGSYLAEVIAIDGANGPSGPKPFTATGSSSFSVIGAASANSDTDSHLDGVDNCPNVANEDQLNTDGAADGGDACDDDDDNDGAADGTDNCRVTPNTTQANNYPAPPGSDPEGDACDDTDSDTVADSTDNCPVVANEGQADGDGNGVGDACDDADGDDVLDVTDNCRNTSNAGQQDGDGDGKGDVCDTCPGVPGAAANGCPPPQVTGSTGTGARTYAQRAANVVISFSAALDPATVDAAHFKLTRSGNPQPGYSVACNSNANCTQVTLDPADDLGGSYAVEVDETVTSHGVAMGADFNTTVTAGPFTESFSSCPAITTSGDGTPWTCSNARLEIASAQRDSSVGNDPKDSVVTLPAVQYTTTAADPMKVTYSYDFDILNDDAGDFAQVDLLRDGGSPTTLKTYSGAALTSGNETLTFTSTAGSHTYALRFTLHLEPATPPVVGPQDAGNVSVDDITLGRS